MRVPIFVGRGVLAALALITATAPPALAQNGSVGGAVVDEVSKRPLSGVQVLIKGTNISTSTGAAGRYILSNVPPGERTVWVRQLGFAPQERPVTVTAGQRATVDFELTTQAVSLTGVVVTGAATATEVRKIGNSIASVNVAELVEKTPILSVDELVKGRTPGLIMNIGQSSVGTPGQIKIRGTKSIALPSDPVVYIDGVKINNSDDRPIFIGGQGINRLADLNPAEIDRVEIVRGAAAATLYGTQGSNGVIQIFTKRGRTGAPESLFESEGGYQQTPTNRFPGRLWTQFTGPTGYRAHDPKEIVDKGRYERYLAQVSGGSETVTYFTSLAFQRQNASIAPSANWNRSITTRANITAILSPKLSLSVRTGLTFNKLRINDSDNALHGLYSQVVAGLPYSATPERKWGERFGNFYANQTVENIQDVLRNTTGFTLDYRMRENFTHNVTLGIDWFGDEFQKYFPYAYQGSGNKLGSKNNITRSVREITFDYKSSLSNTLTSNLTSEFSFGAQGIFFSQNRVTGSGTDFPAPGVRTVSAAATRTAAEDRVQTTNAGLFAQETFGLFDKVFLAAGMRFDGNSAFGNNFKYQWYPKASIAYSVSQEAFWPKSLVPTMKLRVAYGTSGQAPAQFAADRTFTPTSAQNGQPAVTPNNLGNPDLGPETSREIEVGFDAGMLRDRLGIEFTYFSQTTNSALIRKNEPPSSGFLAAQLTNIGQTKSSGIELGLNAALLARARQELNVRLNFATFTSEITDMGGIAPFFVNDARIVQGYPVNSIWRFPLAGWNPTTRRHTAGPDREFAGQIDPKWYGSFSADYRFGRFSIAGMADFQGGNKKMDFSHYWDTRVRSGDHYLSLVQKPNGTTTPAADSLVDYVNTLGSTVFIEPGDFVALSELSLNYNAPDEFSRRLGFRRTSVRLSGRNLYLWTKFPGVDPRLNWRGNVAVGGSADFDSPPIPRVFLLTVRATR
ncbi:MAG: TonB-dependent receptor [Gemmatimonadetes bacterium]|nr:TonB-dependent receptor [Gemmatimonadota bacterium]